MKNTTASLMIFLCLFSNAEVKSQNSSSPNQSFYLDVDFFYLAFFIDFGVSLGIQLNDQAGIGVGYSFAMHYSNFNRCKAFQAVGVQYKHHSKNNRFFSKYEIGIIPQYTQWECFDEDYKKWHVVPGVKTYTKMQHGIRFKNRMTISGAFTFVPFLKERDGRNRWIKERNHPFVMFSLLFGLQFDKHRRD